MRDAKIPAKLHKHKLDFFGHATVTPSDKDFVLGGLVPVSDETLEIYDSIEQVNSSLPELGLYYRKSVTVETSAGEEKSFVYQMTNKFRYTDERFSLNYFLLPMMVEEYIRLGHDEDDIERGLGEHLRNIGLSWKL